MRTVLRFLGFGLLGLVGLVALVYGLRGVVGTIDLATAKHDARSDIEDALPHAQEQAVRDREQVRRAIAGSVEAAGAPAYSWRELSCELESNDSGWIVNDYYQRCVVRSVDLYAVSSAPATCDLVVVRADTVDPLGVAVVKGSSRSLSRQEPWRDMCPDGVLAPSRWKTTRLLDGQRPTDLGSSPGWVVAETSTPVSESTLGCNPWGVVFCLQPVAKPTVPGA